MYSFASHTGTRSPCTYTAPTPDARLGGARPATYPRVEGDDIAGFAKWISHFAVDWTPSKGDFYGYNPLNMMARTLTCTDERWNCDYLKECEARISISRLRTARRR